MPLPRATLATATLEPWPIPRSQIVSGDPHASGLLLHEGLGDVGTGVWECTPGSFDWVYDMHQSLCLVSGEAELAVAGGETFTVRAGDAVVFPAGTRVRWTVRATVRKLYTLYR